MSLQPLPAGIAATVKRDADLAQHPAVLAYHALDSLPAIEGEFIMGGRAGVPGRLELLRENDLPFARIWASYVGNPEGTQPNEKLVAWWCTAEPKLPGARARPFQRTYGDGYSHLFCRYLIRIGEDVATGNAERGTKLPGMAGMYDIAAGVIAPPGPPWSNDEPPMTAFATWEARMYAGAAAADGRHPLAVYFYGCRTPSGINASPGKYYGSGIGGFAVPDAWLVPGQWHCIEQECKMNTVKDPTLRVPRVDVRDFPEATRADNPDLSRYLDAQWIEMDANANHDGEMRVWLDGKLVGEWTNIGYRGLDCVRIQAVPWVNIYQGGHGTYPQGPEHYDLAAMVAATEYVGPPKSTQGDTMADQFVTIVVPEGVKINPITTPDGKPPAGDAKALEAMTTNRNEWKTYAETLLADAQAAKDADTAKVDGQASLDRPKPPVV